MNRPKFAQAVIPGSSAASGCYSEINGLELHDPPSLVLHKLFQGLLFDGRHLLRSN